MDELAGAFSHVTAIPHFSAELCLMAVRILSELFFSDFERLIRPHLEEGLGHNTQLYP